jgi:hypothetical protein
MIIHIQIIYTFKLINRIRKQVVKLSPGLWEPLCDHILHTMSQATQFFWNLLKEINHCTSLMIHQLICSLSISIPCRRILITSKGLQSPPWFGWPLWNNVPLVVTLPSPLNHLQKVHNKYGHLDIRRINPYACDIVCRMSDEYQSHLRSLLTYVLVNNWNFIEYIPVK